MGRLPAGPVWKVNDTRITVAPDPRAPGRWLCLVTVDGERTRQQFATEAAAISRAQVLAKLAENPHYGEATPAQLTVGDLIDRYVQTRNVLNPSRSNATGLRQLYAFDAIRAAWGERPPAMIKRGDVVAWLGGLLKPPQGTGTYAPLTVQQVLRTFCTVLASATDLGLPNPLAKLRMTAARERQAQPWTPQELAAILAAARDEWGAQRPQYLLGLWLWIQSGLRAGEILALRVGAIDADAGTVRVTETFSRGKLGPLKTPRARPPFIVLPTLSSGPDWQPGATAESWNVITFYEHLRVRSLRPEAFLCGVTPETPWCHTVMFRGWQRILDRVGLAYREPEILRHTMAAVMLSRGAPTRFVCDQGAWTSIRIVEKVYAKFLPAAFTAHPRPLEGRTIRPAAPVVPLLQQQLTTVQRKHVK
jgi:integrase